MAIYVNCQTQDLAQSRYSKVLLCLSHYLPLWEFPPSWMIMKHHWASTALENQAPNPFILSFHWIFSYHGIWNLRSWVPEDLLPGYSVKELTDFRCRSGWKMCILSAVTQQMLRGKTCRWATWSVLPWLMAHVATGPWYQWCKEIYHWYQWCGKVW